MRLSIHFFIFLFIHSCQSNAQQKDFEIVCKQFTEAYESMNLPPLGLDYVQNLKNIQDSASLEKQDQIFKKLESSIIKINTQNLSKSDKIDFDLMKYEVALNKFRISLEKRWNNEKPDSISTNSIFHVPNGPSLYTYFLKKWVDVTANPEEIFDFGLKEIERVKEKMEDIQIKSGLDSTAFQSYLNRPQFYFNNSEDILMAYKEKKLEVSQAISELFPGLNEIPSVNMKEFKEDTPIETPGFYNSSENTLYFKYFDRPYSNRQIGWLYIHEGIPGHHYQIKYANNLELSEIQKLVGSSCYREGWAAYIEEIGYEIGAYKNIYDEYGKWEWDLIRSVRVSMDVGLNYHGWSDEKALSFWQQHIKEQDHIAHREIKRMKRWPTQVITYKYGVNKLLHWRKHFEKESSFSPLEFHKNILAYGDIPFFVLERHLGMTGYNEIYNIPYTKATREIDNPNQRLNLVIPDTSEKPPLLIWIGGGAWAYVDRNIEMNVARNFAQQGIAVASVGHRLSADWRDTSAIHTIQHPDHVKDIAKATKWLVDHAEEYGYDQDKIFVGGFSSGAHLASILALNHTFLKENDLSKDNIKGIIPIGGTYDIADYYQVFLNSERPSLAEIHVQSVFGKTQEHFESASPTTFLDYLSIPILLISDTRTFNYTKIFEEAIKQRNFDGLQVYHSPLNHGDLWRDMSENDKSIYREMVLKFIHEKS